MNIKRWANALISLTKVIITECKNQNSIFRQPILDKATFNSYMAYAEGSRDYNGYLYRPSNKHRYDGKHQFFNYFNTYDGYDDRATPKEPPVWFEKMIDRYYDFFFATHIYATALISQRKWTEKLIENYLPEPDHKRYMYSVNREKGIHRMYKLATIERVEATPEFQADWAVLTAKREARSNKSNCNKTYRIKNPQLTDIDSSLLDLSHEPCQTNTSKGDDFLISPELDSNDDTAKQDELAKLAKIDEDEFNNLDLTQLTIDDNLLPDSDFDSDFGFLGGLFDEDDDSFAAILQKASATQSKADKKIRSKAKKSTKKLTPAVHALTADNADNSLISPKADDKIAKHDGLTRLSVTDEDEFVNPSLKELTGDDDFDFLQSLDDDDSLDDMNFSSLLD